MKTAIATKTVSADCPICGKFILLSNEHVGRCPDCPGAIQLVPKAGSSFFDLAVCLFKGLTIIIISLFLGCHSTPTVIDNELFRQLDQLQVHQLQVHQVQVHQLPIPPRLSQVTLPVFDVSTLSMQEKQVFYQVCRKRWGK